MKQIFEKSVTLCYGLLLALTIFFALLKIYFLFDYFGHSFIERDSFLRTVNSIELPLFYGTVFLFILSFAFPLLGKMKMRSIASYADYTPQWVKILSISVVMCELIIYAITIRGDGARLMGGNGNIICFLFYWVAGFRVALRKPNNLENQVI